MPIYSRIIGLYLLFALYNKYAQSTNYCTGVPNRYNIGQPGCLLILYPSTYIATTTMNTIFTISVYTILSLLYIS